MSADISGLILAAAGRLVLTFNDDKVCDRAAQSKSNYLLILWRSVPSFSGLSRREFDYDETRVLPLPFQ